LLLAHGIFYAATSWGAALPGDSRSQVNAAT
jgi:hypothetical protein